MTTEERIIDYSNKAQTKISELTDLIEVQIRNGSFSEKETDSVIELLDFHESINNAFCPWDDLTKVKWIEFFELRYNMVDIPSTICEDYTLPVFVSVGGDGGISQSELNAAINAVMIQFDTLSDSVQELLDFDFSTLVPQTLIDDVATAKSTSTANASSIVTLTTRVATDEAALAAHIADTSKHIQAGERANWNAKVTSAQLTAGLATKAATDHGHEIEDVEGLQSSLNSLQQQIDDIPEPEEPETGATPNIAIGAVEEGEEFAVELDAASTPELPIINFTLKSGADGEGLQIDVIDSIENKPDYDFEDAGFVFVSSEASELYKLITPAILDTSDAVWSLPISLRGLSGWTPIIAVANISDDIAVHQVIDWIGGTGDKPWPNGEVENLFLSTAGYTAILSQATNIKGPQGIEGAPGTFQIDAQGTDRSIHDDQIRPFIFYNTSTGQISYKLSDGSGDWSPTFQWKGDQGIQGLTGPGLPIGGTAGQFVKKSSETDYETEWDTFSKSTVGLSNVDNTSDENKPVSIAQQAAITAVQNELDVHEARTDNPHTVTKSQVGLGNADNTSDANKPVSTAQQTALDLKADKSNVLGLDNTTPFTPSADYHPSTKKFTEDLVSALDKATPKGGIDCSTNPNYPAGVIGDYYYVTVAGKIGGVAGIDVEQFDKIQCIVDSASGDHAAVGANWAVFQGNLDKATESEAQTGTDNEKYMTVLRSIQGWSYWNQNSTISALNTTDKTVVGAINEVVAGLIALDYVNGPVSSTDNAVAMFNGITGKLLKNSNLYFNDGRITSDSETLAIGASDNAVIEFYTERVALYNFGFYTVLTGSSTAARAISLPDKNGIVALTNDLTSFLTSVNNDNWSGADLTIVNGGTGASSASAARTNLGLVIGTAVQAQSSKLQAFVDLADSAGVLTSDGAGNYSWGAGAGFAISGTDGNNKLISADGAGGGVYEDNLTFDGSNLVNVGSNAKFQVGTGNTNFSFQQLSGVGTVWSQTDTGITSPTLRLRATALDDSGSEPIFQFLASKSGGAAITTRPILVIDNSSSSPDRLFTVLATGQIRLNKYPGSFTGTVSKLLAVDSSGNVIVTDPSGGGFSVSGTTDNGLITYDSGGGGVVESSITYASNTLAFTRASASGWNFLTALNSSQPDGAAHGFYFGKAAAANQAGYITYTYSATAANNKVSIGFFGNTDLLQINQLGQASVSQITASIINAAGKLIFSTSELTIASGIVTVTLSEHTLDNQSDDAADDLVTINGGTTGQELRLSGADASRVTTIKTTGNIRLKYGEFKTSGPDRYLILKYDGTNWQEITRSLAPEKTIIHLGGWYDSPTTANIVGFRATEKRKLLDVELCCGADLASGSSFIVQILKNGSPMLDDPMELEVGETTSKTATTQPTYLSTTWDNQDLIEFEITTEDSSSAVTGVHVTLTTIPTT